MSRRRNIHELPQDRKEAIAENLKERVYSTITLLAVLTVLWNNGGERSALSVIYTILGTVIALWLAVLIADRMSYRAIYGKVISGRAYIRTIYATSGLLAPAIMPIILVGLSGLTGWYSLETALLVSMGVSLLFLFGLSFSTGWKLYDNIWQLVLVSTLEMLVGFGIIILKIAVGE
jgi:hypothetical protein